MTATKLDPYVTLGIPAGASRDEAARAHRRLAKESHPDVNPGPAAAERMRRVNDAWRILSDPARRLELDAELRRAARAAHGGRGSGGASWDRVAHGPRSGSTTWTTWPESRRPMAPRFHRPERPERVEPSFGDRPAVVVSVGVILMMLYVVGTWLGSIAP